MALQNSRNEALAALTEWANNLGDRNALYIVAVIAVAAAIAVAIVSCHRYLPAIAMAVAGTNTDWFLAAIFGAPLVAVGVSYLRPTQGN